MSPALPASALTLASPAGLKNPKGPCRFLLGLYRDNGKENGSYRDCRVYIGIIGSYVPKGPCRYMVHT